MKLCNLGFEDYSSLQYNDSLSKYRDFYYKDKIVKRLSNGNAYTNNFMPYIIDSFRHFFLLDQ